MSDLVSCSFAPVILKLFTSMVAIVTINHINKASPLCSYYYALFGTSRSNSSNTVPSEVRVQV